MAWESGYFLAWRIEEAGLPDSEASMKGIGRGELRGLLRTE